MLETSTLGADDFLDAAFTGALVVFIISVRHIRGLTIKGYNLQECGLFGLDV